MNVAGLSSLEGGVAVSDKFSVNTTGQVVATSLVVARSRLPQVNQDKFIKI